MRRAWAVTGREGAGSWSFLGVVATRKLKSNKARVSVFAFNTRGALPSVFEEETVR
jgi:ABC-type molybdenum transport system ATPase subunit/photorepair protein PhrA